MSIAQFSVAMSVYYKDKAEYFEKALDSIIVNQTVVPNEIVLVCDGPLTKDLEEVIGKYQKVYNGFNIIRLEENKGLGNALKVAVENATYELIARMDSDDIAVPNRFEQQLIYFENNRIDIVGGDFSEFIEEETNIVGIRKVPCSDKEIKEYMKKRAAFNHVTVMYKKSSVLAAGGYIDWYYNEDYYLWIRMQLNNAVFANTGTTLVNVRVGQEMYQRRGGRKYFKSEYELQKYMLKQKMIKIPTFVLNVLKRFIVQVILPNRIRGWVFRKFARRPAEVVMMDKQ